VSPDSVSLVNKEMPNREHEMQIFGKRVEWAIMTRAYRGQEFQSGPNYATRREAAKAFSERGFRNDPTARIAPVWI